MEILVLGRAVSNGLTGSLARPEAMSAAADRIAGWAEAMVGTDAGCRPKPGCMLKAAPG
jgi:hypothetical protein